MVLEGSINTIPHIHNTNVVSILGKRFKENPNRYPISHIIRLINRSSLGLKNSDKYLPAGALQKEDLLMTQNIASGLFTYDKGFELPYYFGFTMNHKKVVYEGLSLPGWSYGKEIYKHLDVKWNELINKKLTRRQRLDLIAFISIVIGTTHAFKDGNGRTDRGTVLLLLENLLGKKIPQDILLKRKSEYAKTKQGATLRLLPGRFSPKHVLYYMYRNNEQGLQITLPLGNNELKDELPHFLWGYAQNIIQFIDNFTLPIKSDHKFLNIEYSVRKIADFYDRVTGGYNYSRL